MESTTRFEAEVARRNSPEIAWPTIALAIGGLALWVLSSWAALAGGFPLLAAAAVNTLVMYAIYTPLHDASHGAVVDRARRRAPPALRSPSEAWPRTGNPTLARRRAH